MKITSLLLILPFLIVAQEKKGNGKNLFDKVYKSYSSKKISIVNLKDGSKVEGYKKDVDRKKGQIYYIKIKDKETGKKRKFNAPEIKELYLHPTGIEKLGNILRHATDTRQWAREDLDKAVINKGAIVFKNQIVSLKNKKKPKEYLMQLINPTFSKHIEVYGDPFAKETFSLGVAGLNVAGGLAKSYYLKKGTKMFWLRKKDLNERYEFLFGDSDEFTKKYPVKDIKWRYLSEYIFEYTKMKS